jgi:hypothetical protein
MKSKFQEKGQALIVIAVAAIVLFSFTALAIDGSIVFSDRRHSQNASDAAVLAAALAKVQKESKGMNVDWHQIGLDRAKDNHYDDADPVTEVQVKLCTEDIVFSNNAILRCSGLPVGEPPDQFIHVGIKSVVNLTLAQVMGWTTITNYTQAVSRATVPDITNWYDGYGIAALHEGCWSGRDKPFTINGNPSAVVDGAGVLVNAICPGDESFIVNGSRGTLSTTTGLCAPGTDSVPTNQINPGLRPGCNPVDPSRYQMPAEPECKNADGSIRYGRMTEGPSGVWTAIPGTYNGSFPGVHGQATVLLTKGVYCLNDGIRINAGMTFTTDLDNNGHEPASEGALFYIPGGDITINGGAEINVHAISQTSSDTFSPYWLNMLIYIPETNEATVSLSGNSGSTFTGTIFAPSSDVELSGTARGAGGTITLNSQIISDTVKISGTSDIVIVYNDADNAVTIENPGVALISD